MLIHVLALFVTAGERILALIMPGGCLASPSFLQSHSLPDTVPEEVQLCPPHLAGAIDLNLTDTW